MQPPYFRILHLTSASERHAPVRVFWFLWRVQRYSCQAERFQDLCLRCFCTNHRLSCLIWIQYRLLSRYRISHSLSEASLLSQNLWRLPCPLSGTQSHAVEEDPFWPPQLHPWLAMHLFNHLIWLRFPFGNLKLAHFPKSVALLLSIFPEGIR